MKKSKSMSFKGLQVLISLIVIAISAVFILLIQENSMVEAKSFEAVALKCFDSQILVYRTDDVDDKLVYIKADGVKIVDNAGKEIELNNIKPSAMISVLYNDEIILPVAPPTYVDIQIITHLGFDNRALYEQALIEASWYLY